MDGDVALAERSVSLDVESIERLARLCADSRCTPEQVVRDALLALEQLDEDEKGPSHVWTEHEDAAMREAIAEFENGEGIPHDQVMAEARALIGR